MTMGAWKWIAAAALLSLGAGGCMATPEDAAGDGDESTAEVRRRPVSPYYILRQDFRRCAYPFCGGAWVREVNQSSTRCADGTFATECYVGDVDYSALGLDDATLETFRNRAQNGQALVRGRLATHDYGPASLGQLVATEGWRAVTDAEPTGSFYRVTDNGIRCITAPCFSYDRERLNTTSTGTLSNVVLNLVPGATDADLDSGYEGLHGATEGILVAGRIVNVTRGGRDLRASQFYLRVGRSVSDAVYCDADAQCTSTVYHSAPSSAADCYCRYCPNAVLNVSTATSNESAWSRVCGGRRMTCPLVRCARPPAVSCVNHACAFVTE